MILNLYGNEGLIFNTLAVGFTEAHLQDSFKFDVVSVDDVGSKFKDAVKKEFTAKFLDDSDMVIRFAIPSVAKPEEEDEDETDAEDIDAEDIDDEKETKEEEPKEEEEEEDTAETEEDEKDSEDKSEDEDESEKDDEKNQTLKESTTSENDISQKILKTVKRCLFVKDTDMVEISELPDFMDGYRVLFIKVSMTDKNKKQAV